MLASIFYFLTALQVWCYSIFQMRQWLLGEVKLTNTQHAGLDVGATGTEG